jgi:hypothetical protein
MRPFVSMSIVRFYQVMPRASSVAFKSEISTKPHLQLRDEVPQRPRPYRAQRVRHARHDQARPLERCLTHRANAARRALLARNLVRDLLFFNLFKAVESTRVSQPCR